MAIKICTDKLFREISNNLDHFIRTHHLRNIYQSSAFYDLYIHTKNYEPLLLLAFENNAIIGSLLAVIIKERAGVTGKLTARSIIIGGPLARKDDKQTINQLMREYNIAVKSNAIYTEIREINPLSFENILTDAGYGSERRINIIINLNKDEETLWKEVNSKRRNEIRRAEKVGIIVKEFSDENAVNESYNILTEVYKRARLPLADRSLFLSANEILSPEKNIRFFGAFYNDALVGTMYTLCYKDRVIDWYAGSKKEHYDKYPNDLITWEVIKKVKKEGYKIFDFGGASKPDVPYGVRDYKKKFGGEFIELTRYQKVHKPILMKTGKLGLKLWQKFK